jgi:hypothetical protein
VILAENLVRVPTPVTAVHVTELTVNGAVPVLLNVSFEVVTLPARPLKVTVVADDEMVPWAPVPVSDVTAFAIATGT